MPNWHQNSHQKPSNPAGLAPNSCENQSNNFIASSRETAVIV